mmetsp:Transcript_28026/g.40116  ORF Transcript_28026/g.40116 Transcript_28026/m.40116 type:complete len:732 (-) Transcript_28026:478-2673(-)
MCIPTYIAPPKNHFLHRPIKWTQEVWKTIQKYRGNANEIERLFNLFPVIETYIEESIGVELTRNILQDSSLILQDDYVNIQVDNWQRTKYPQYPSIVQQLCRANNTSIDYFSSNFYSPLATLPDFTSDYFALQEMMDQPTPNPISATTQVSANNTLNVDLIDMESLETLIQEQQKRDQASFLGPSHDESISQTQTAANANMYIHRIDVKRIFKTPEKTCETLKRFFIALKKVDPHAALRPVYAGDANRVPVINSSTQVQNPELLEVSKYHKSWTPNQRYGLSGQLLVESSYDFNELTHLLQPWLHSAYYQIALAECQTSELVTIGVLIRTSYTLCRSDMISATKAVVSNLKEESQFEFSLRADNWFCSVGKVNVLFVAVARDKLKQGMDYFCNMYDGVNKKVPIGAPLLFIPLYQIQLTPEIREQIGQEQRAWQDNEIACFVNGFRDLSTMITLKDGTNCTLRSLILRIPNHQRSPRKALFHGVDRRPESTEWLALKYHRDDETVFKAKAPSIAYTLAQLVIEDDVSKIFVDPSVGLNFGGEWRKTFSANTKSGRKANPTPADPALLSHFHSVLTKLQPAVIKRPAITPDPMQHSKLPPSTIQASYATRAAATTYTSSTSTTYNNNSSSTTTPSRQTRTESVVVIEQYEARFVHVESRLTMVEKTVNKSGNMLAKLLRHNGIDIDDDENIDPVGGPMEIEAQGPMEGGTKRVCPSSHRELSQSALINNNHV